MQVDGFDWDLGNKDKNTIKHNVSSQEIEQVILSQNSIYFFEERHSFLEDRYILFGKTKSGRLLTVAYTVRLKGHKKYIRPISARPMHKKERLFYEKES